MKNFTEKEPSNNTIGWFSFELTKYQSYYLYTVSIIGFFIGIGWIIRIFSPLISIGLHYIFKGVILPIDLNAILFMFISSLVPSVIIILFLYNILKIKRFLAESPSQKNEEKIKWFGIIINNNQASLLFFLAFSGILFSIFYIYVNSFPFFLYLHTLVDFFGNLFENLFSAIVFSALGIIILLTSLYTYRKTRKLTKRVSEIPLWFGFELKEQTRLVIYVGSIILLILICFFGFGFGFFTAISLMPWEWLNTTAKMTFIIGIGLMILNILIALYSFIKIRKVVKYN